MVRIKHETTNVSVREPTLQLQLTQSSGITRTIEKLHTQFGKHIVPIAELRKALDKEMGKKTLTEELYAMREGR